MESGHPRVVGHRSENANKDHEKEKVNDGTHKAGPSDQECSSKMSGLTELLCMLDVFQSLMKVLFNWQTPTSTVQYGVGRFTFVRKITTL